MKYLIKITIGLIALLSFSTQSLANQDLNSTEVSIRKTKPTPKYTIDLINKKIIFVDVSGSYLIDNAHIDVVLEGIVSTANQILDISKLAAGTYLLEIEHLGYIFTEELIIK